MPIPSVAHSLVKSFDRKSKALLRQVPVTRHGRILQPLQVLPLNQALNPLLNHVDIRLELRRQLRNRLGEELGVWKILACSAKVEMLAYTVSRESIW